MALFTLLYKCKCGETWSWLMSSSHDDFCIKCHAYPVKPYKMVPATPPDIELVMSLNRIAERTDEWRKTTERVVLSEGVSALSEWQQMRIIAAAQKYEFPPHTGPGPLGFDQHDNFTIEVDGKTYQCGVRFWDLRVEQFTTALSNDMNRRLLRICTEKEELLPYN